MITRNWVVLMPSDAGQTAALDLPLHGPTGSNTNPVAAAGANRTAPATGWNGGDGAYYERRSRILRVPILAGTAGAVPRTRLGILLSAVDLATGATVPLSMNLSASAMETLGDGTIIAQVILADPTYGPVIRLFNTAGTQGRRYLVTLAVAEAKDEDREAQLTA